MTELELNAFLKQINDPLTTELKISGGILVPTLAFTVPQLQSLVTALKKSPNIKRIDLGYISLADINLVEILEELIRTRTTTIQELRLYRASINTEGANKLFAAMHANTSLREVDFTGNHIDSLAALEALLKSNNSLQNILLEDNPLDAEEVKSVFINCKDNKSLKYLALPMNIYEGEETERPYYSIVDYSRPIYIPKYYGADADTQEILNQINVSRAALNNQTNEEWAAFISSKMYAAIGTLPALIGEKIVSFLGVDNSLPLKYKREINFDHAHNLSSRKILTDAELSKKRKNVIKNILNQFQMHKNSKNIAPLSEERAKIKKSIMNHLQDLTLVNHRDIYKMSL
jgi:hypothetical protein